VNARIGAVAERLRERADDANWRQFWALFCLSNLVLVALLLVVFASHGWVRQAVLAVWILIDASVGLLMFCWVAYRVVTHRRRSSAPER
jgi:hypothetical protein